MQLVVVDGEEYKSHFGDMHGMCSRYTRFVENLILSLRSISFLKCNAGHIPTEFE